MSPGPGDGNEKASDGEAMVKAMVTKRQRQASGERTVKPQPQIQGKKASDDQKGSHVWKAAGEGTRQLQISYTSYLEGVAREVGGELEPLLVDVAFALATDVVYVALIEPVTCQLHVWRDQGGGATKVVYIAPRTHFRVSGLGFRVSGLGFRNSGFGFRFRVSGLGFRISGFGFSLWYFGFRGSGSETLPARRGGGRTCDGSRARPGRGGS